MSSTPQLLTYKEVGAYLRITERSVYELVRAGRLKAVRFGGNVRFDPVDVREFVQSAKDNRGGQGA